MIKNLINRTCEIVKKPALIGITVATLAVMPYISGCHTQQKTNPIVDTLTKEQELAVLMQMNENEQKKKEQELAVLMQMNENDEARLRQQQIYNNYPAESKADKDFREILDVYKILFFGLGSDITKYEYMKRN